MERMEPTSGLFAAITVSKMNTDKLKIVIGIVTTLPGALTLAKTFLL